MSNDALKTETEIVDWWNAWLMEPTLQDINDEIWHDYVQENCP